MESSKGFFRGSGGGERAPPLKSTRGWCLPSGKSDETDRSPMMGVIFGVQGGPPDPVLTGLKQLL